MANTKQPTAVKIARNKGKFSASWSKHKTKVSGTNYSYSEITYSSLFDDSNDPKNKKGKVTKDAWSKGKRSTTTGKVDKLKTVDFTKYYPYNDNKIYKIGIRVKAKTKKSGYPKKYSKDAYKYYEFKVPNKPSITVTEGTYPSATFTSTINTNDSMVEVFSRFMFRTCLEENSTSTDGPTNAKWGKWEYFDNQHKTKLDGATSRSKEYIENTSTIAGKKYTRWFQVKAQGPRGDVLSNPKAMRYALPNEPTILEDPKPVASKNESYYNVTFSYKIERTANTPITSIMPQYYIGNPSDSSLNPPTSGWTDTVTTIPSGKATENVNGKASFNTTMPIQENQCLWVRVVTKNSDKQNQQTPSDPYLVTKGILSSPENVDVDPLDETSLRTRVTATNPASSSVPGSFIAVYHLIDGKNSCIGVIPNGSTSTIIQFSSYEPSPTIRLKTVSGSYEAASSFVETEDASVVEGKLYFRLVDDEYIPVANPSGNPSENGWYEIDGESLYTVKENWSSVFVEGSSTIRAPQNVTASRTDVSGSIRVNWDWPWKNADTAELSWSDSKESWESTTEPSKYEISQAKPGSWIINGLENGKDWYIRVRLGISSSDSSGTNFGPYSDAQPWPLSLTSNPSTPLVDASKKVITQDGETTLSWVYSSADGQEQESATVYEVLEENSQEIYNEIETIGSQQYVNIKAEEKGWSTGEEHALAIKVKSKAGLVSENYSNIVRIKIADQITCAISNLSLVDGELKAMPLTFKAIAGYSLTEDETIVEDKSYYSREDTTTYTYNALGFIEDPRYQEVIDPTGDPSAAGWYEFNGTDYILSQDTEVNPEKKYYVRFVENPSENKWYEESGQDYIETQDTSIVPGKTYYIRSGEPNYIYSVIQNPSGNPKTSGYFEVVELSQDLLTTAVIRRAEDFKKDRPDGSEIDGFRDETVYSGSPDSNRIFTINNADIIGYLDDRADYIIDLDIQDDLGQTSHAEVPFTVNWTHQAWYPEATVQVDQEQTVAFLMPIAPKSSIEYVKTSDEELLEKKYYISNLVSNPIDEELSTYFEMSDSAYVYTTDQVVDPNKDYYLIEEVLDPVVEEIGSYYEYTTIDVCDIYRLSVDKPELIYEGAMFGETYVDPYPTIGEYGGHRFVCRTANGDYITDEDEIAWVDTDADDGDLFETHSNIIDFNGEQVFLLYEVDLSNSWSKDFQETRYLGGSIQGDWNPGISRTSSLNVTAVSDYDQDMIRAMHRLADYPGICHVRTKDGSSYSADVQINETYEYTRAPRFNKYDLSITRVDPETMDAVTLEEWQREHSEESE